MLNLCVFVLTIYAVSGIAGMVMKYPYPGIKKKLRADKKHSSDM